MKKNVKVMALALAAAMMLGGCGTAAGSGTQTDTENATGSQSTDSNESADSNSNTDSGNGTAADTTTDTTTDATDSNSDSADSSNETASGSDATEDDTSDLFADPYFVNGVDFSQMEVVPNDSASFVANLDFGWNLGNTLDAEGKDETAWGQPKVTQELINYIKECGFTTIRIPVTWSTHMDENYTIDADWMARVTEIVDWSLDAGLYVIINSHHDVDYYYPSEENMDNAKLYINTVWTQIAENFADYDERLIFEGMNEPRLKGTDIEWWFQSSNAEGCAAIERISELDQLFVYTVRSCGGNNTSRYLMVSSYDASPDFTMHKSFTIPTDPYGKLIISIHAYSPYDFAMNANGYTAWDGSHSSELNFITKLNSTFVEKGYGVIISEFGVTNKDNEADRVAWAKEYTSLAASYGIPCIVWDNGGTGVGEENFGLIDRTNLKVYFPDLLEAYLSGYAD